MRLSSPRTVHPTKWRLGVHREQSVLWRWRGDSGANFLLVCFFDAGPSPSSSDEKARPCCNGRGLLWVAPKQRSRVDPAAELRESCSGELDGDSWQTKPAAHAGAPELSPDSASQMPEAGGPLHTSKEPK